MDRTDLAQIEAIDRSNAFEWGFFKAAQEAGLSKVEYEKMRKTAAEIPQLAAPPMPRLAEPGIPEILSSTPTNAPRYEPKAPVAATPSQYKPNLADILGRAYRDGGAVPNAMRLGNLVTDAVSGNHEAKADRARTVAHRQLGAAEMGVRNAQGTPAYSAALTNQRLAARKEQRLWDRQPRSFMQNVGDIVRAGENAVEPIINGGENVARVLQGRPMRNTGTTTRVLGGIKDLLTPPETDVDDTNVEKANRAEAPANPDFKQLLQKAQK